MRFTEMNYYTGCNIIFRHYGAEHQKKQLIQELSELIVAITKNDLENIIEEIADVQVMLDQFKIANPELQCKAESIMLMKVKRQLARIRDEQERDRIIKHKNQEVENV